MSVRKNRRGHSASDGAHFSGYILGIFVTLGGVAGFVLPFVEGVDDFLIANAPLLGAVLGLLSGVALALLVEWLFGMGGRGGKWLLRHLGFGPARAAEPDLSISNSPLVDNLSPSNSTGARLDRAMVGAQRLDVCTSYVSKAGLERLSIWLDQMDQDARVRLLIGMGPKRWQDRGQGILTDKAAPHFLARHLQYNNQYDKAILPVMERLELHQANGRLEVRLRNPRAALHAKLYVWTDAGGRQANLIGSSNLTRAGLDVQGELNAHMRKMESIRYFVAWFDARWQEKDSVGDVNLLAHTKQVVNDTGD